MNFVWHTGVLLEIVVAWAVIIAGRQTIRRTTLTTAWVWSVICAITWTLTWISDQVTGLMSAALADHVWHVCAVLALCPPMAVLGSRRPGTRVWTWFILLPMLFVLCWPILAGLVHGGELRRLQLETPQLVAYCLVVVMGIGNYCGTRFTLSALLYAGAVLSIVWVNSADYSAGLVRRDSVRFWCTVTVALAVCLVATSRRAAEAPLDRLWLDFFDLFGLVWGRRIQDRVNFLAQKETLPVRLELDGFAWDSHDASENTNVAKMLRDETEARVEHLLRWLLRRFVDSQWIDDRLGHASPSVVKESAVDS